MTISVIDTTQAHVAWREADAEYATATGAACIGGPARPGGDRTRRHAPVYILHRSAGVRAAQAVAVARNIAAAA